LPSGSRSVISRDLNQSLNEFLFEPALPILTVDTKERYPEDRNLERSLYGLKRRLEQDDSKYIEDIIDYDFNNQLFGKARVTCYVFKTKIEGKTVKESKESIQREFFKNDMAVLFSMNGQVHGHYTSEFISRALKLSLLKSHLLIHVDCTSMEYEFRKEMFMASRDRLKDSEETRDLRKFLADQLGKAGSRLHEMEKKRKDSISVDSSDSKELLKSVAKNIMLSPDLRKLLGNTFKLEPQKEEKGPKEKQEQKQPNGQAKEPFKPKRFPSFLKLQAKNDGNREITKVPIGGERTIKFGTDVENQYFNRIEEPGELKIGLLGMKQNGQGRGTAKGTPSRIEDLLNVSVSSPHEGCIKVVLNPQKETKVGDSLKLRVSLTSPETPEGEFEEIFWVKISEKEAPLQPVPKEDEEQSLLGLPEPVFMYKEQHEKAVTWEEVGASTGSEISFRTIIHPLVTGDNLEKIYINMDSDVLKNFKSKHKNINEEQLQLTGRKYWTAVYMHTLFLYSITKNRKYQVMQDQSGQQQEVEIGDYIKDLFENYYSEFILNYGGMEELMTGLAS